MREIKFRAWYVPRKEMVEPDKLESINFEVKTLGVYLPIENKGYNKLRLSDFILMQWTGLVDRNGKEIYEGDIAKHLEPESEDGPAFEEIGVVEWGDSAGYLHTCKNDDGETRWLLSTRYMEVIGNVHDNPELIGGA